MERRGCFKASCCCFVHDCLMATRRLISQLPSARHYCAVLGLLALPWHNMNTVHVCNQLFILDEGGKFLDINVQCPGSAKLSRSRSTGGQAAAEWGDSERGAPWATAWANYTDGHTVHPASTGCITRIQYYMVL